MKHILYPLLVLSFCAACLISCANGENCDSLRGSWYGDLGEEIFMMDLGDGEIRGKFYSELERATGDPEKLIHSRLDGYMPYKKRGDVFGFSVSFLNGASIKTWTGQCEVCEDGEEKLYTSWVIRSVVKTCRDKWKSTMIGQNIFTRQKPSDKMTLAVEMENNVPYSIDFGSAYDRGNNRLPNQVIKDKCADISGTWYNDVGSEIILSEDATGLISGEYRTAVERDAGSAGKSHSGVMGFRETQGSNSTLAFSVVWRKGASITGFVGQCHICSKDAEPIIETAWILRVKVDKCEDNWKSTMFGSNTFTRHEQKTGPRKAANVHAPARDGEASELTLCSSTSWIKANTVLLLPFLFSLFCIR